MKIKDFKEWMNEDNIHDKEILSEITDLASAYCGMMHDKFADMVYDNKLSHKKVPQFKYNTNNNVITITVNNISKSDIDMYLNKNMLRTASYETHIGNKIRLQFNCSEPQKIKDYVTYTITVS